MPCKCRCPTMRMNCEMKKMSHDGGSHFRNAIVRRIYLLAKTYEQDEKQRDVVGFQRDLYEHELERRRYALVWKNRRKWAEAIMTISNAIVQLMMVPIVFPFMFLLTVSCLFAMLFVGVPHGTTELVVIRFFSTRLARIGCDFLEVAPQWIAWCDLWWMMPMRCAVWVWKWCVHVMIDSCECSLTGQ